MLEQMTMLPVIASTFRLDESRRDEPDVLFGSREQGLWDEIQRIAFPGLTENSGKRANKVADVDHLLGHKLAARDVFVTDDRDILRRYPELRDGPGIIVMSPEQCLRFVDAHFARQEKRPLEPTGGADAHRDTRLRGPTVRRLACSCPNPRLDVRSAPVFRLLANAAPAEMEDLKPA